MKLISMTDFVLSLSETSTFDKDFVDWHYEESCKLDKIRNYANFLKTPITLGMFIPVDENGEIVNRPQYETARIIEYQKEEENIFKRELGYF